MIYIRELTLKKGKETRWAYLSALMHTNFYIPYTRPIYEKFKRAVPIEEHEEPLDLPRNTVMRILKNATEAYERKIQKTLKGDSFNP